MIFGNDGETSQSQFWEEKKQHPLNSAQEEQRREECRTLQTSILAPIQGTYRNIYYKGTSSNSVSATELFDDNLHKKLKAELDALS